MITFKYLWWLLLLVIIVIIVYILYRYDVFDFGFNITEGLLNNSIEITDIPFKIIYYNYDGSDLTDDKIKPYSYFKMINDIISQTIIFRFHDDPLYTSVFADLNYDTKWNFEKSTSFLSTLINKLYNNDENGIQKYINACSDYNDDNKKSTIQTDIEKIIGTFDNTSLINETSENGLKYTSYYLKNGYIQDQDATLKLLNLIRDNLTIINDWAVLNYILPSNTYVWYSIYDFHTDSDIDSLKTKIAEYKLLIKNATIRLALINGGDGANAIEFTDMANNSVFGTNSKWGEAAFPNITIIQNVWWFNKLLNKNNLNVSLNEAWLDMDRFNNLSDNSQLGYSGDDPNKNKNGIVRIQQADLLCIYDGILRYGFRPYTTDSANYYKNYMPTTNTLDITIYNDEIYHWDNNNNENYIKISDILNTLNSSNTHLKYYNLALANDFNKSIIPGLNNNITNKYHSTKKNFTTTIEKTFLVDTVQSKITDCVTYFQNFKNSPNTIALRQKLYDQYQNITKKYNNDKNDFQQIIDTILTNETNLLGQVITTIDKLTDCYIASNYARHIITDSKITSIPIKPNDFDTIILTTVFGKIDDIYRYNTNNIIQFDKGDPVKDHFNNFKFIPTMNGVIDNIYKPTVVTNLDNFIKLNDSVSKLNNTPGSNSLITLDSIGALYSEMNILVKITTDIYLKDPVVTRSGNSNSSTPGSSNSTSGVKNINWEGQWSNTTMMNYTYSSEGLHAVNYLLHLYNWDLQNIMVNFLNTCYNAYIYGLNYTYTNTNTNTNTSKPTIPLKYKNYTTDQIIADNLTMTQNGNVDTDILTAFDILLTRNDNVDGFLNCLMNIRDLMISQIVRFTNNYNVILKYESVNKNLIVSPNPSIASSSITNKTEYYSNVAAAFNKYSAQLNEICGKLNDILKCYLSNILSNYETAFSSMNDGSLGSSFQKGSISKSNVTQIENYIESNQNILKWITILNVTYYNGSAPSNTGNGPSSVDPNTNFIKGIETKLNSYQNTEFYFNRGTLYGCFNEKETETLNHMGIPPINNSSPSASSLIITNPTSISVVNNMDKNGIVQKYGAINNCINDTIAYNALNHMSPTSYPFDIVTLKSYTLSDNTPVENAYTCYAGYSKQLNTYYKENESLYKNNIVSDIGSCSVSAMNNSNVNDYNTLQQNLVKNTIIYKINDVAWTSDDTVEYKGCYQKDVPEKGIYNTIPHLISTITGANLYVENPKQIIEQCKKNVDDYNSKMGTTYDIFGITTNPDDTNNIDCYAGTFKFDAANAFAKQNDDYAAGCNLVSPGKNNFLIFQGKSASIDKCQTKSTSNLDKYNKSLTDWLNKNITAQQSAISSLTPDMDILNGLLPIKFNISQYATTSQPTLQIDTMATNQLQKDSNTPGDSNTSLNSVSNKTCYLKIGLQKGPPGPPGPSGDHGTDIKNTKNDPGEKGYQGYWGSRS